MKIERRQELEKLLEDSIIGEALVSIEEVSKGLNVWVRMGEYYIDFRLETNNYRTAKDYIIDYAKAINRTSKKF